jgi:hypothetical protein
MYLTIRLANYIISVPMCLPHLAHRNLPVVTDGMNLMQAMLVCKQYYQFHTLERPEIQRNNDEVSYDTIDQ